MAKFQSVRGTHDLYGDEAYLFRSIEQTTRTIAQNYGYSEIITPIFEFTEVFARGMGETSDVVSKEMYSFTRSDDNLTLRPEGTAGVCRALISNGMEQDLPLKFFYYGPMFRYERPQKGRQRQFHQVGLELLGVETPQADIEIISATKQMLQTLGIFDGVKVHINTLGDNDSRAAYRDALLEYLNQYKDELSEDSKVRLEKNPLRILDSKDEGDKKIVANAPLMADYLNDESKEFFATVLHGLDVLNIPYVIDNSIVRGLDYYTHTVFEFIDESERLGSQSTVAAGGRYNGLVKLLGGGNTCGVGMSAGVERLMLMMGECKNPARPIVVVPVSANVFDDAAKITENLRQNGHYAELGFSGNMSKRMKKADKQNAWAAVIIGEDELANNQVLFRDLDTGNQENIDIKDLEKAIANRRKA